MRKIIIVLFIIISIPCNVFAETDEEIMKSTQEQFNISSFIKEAEQYTGVFFEDLNITEMLNEAVQGNVDNKAIYITDYLFCSIYINSHTNYVKFYRNNKIS